MDIQALKLKITRDIDEFQNLLKLAEEVESDQKSVTRQNAIITQRGNALSTREIEVARDLKKVETERQELFTKGDEIERQLELISKQKSDHTLKMGEMRVFQTVLEEKLEKVKETEQREKDVIIQEEKNAKTSTELAHREGLIAKEKEIIRERKIQLDKLEEQKQAKLTKLNKMLGE